MRHDQGAPERQGHESPSWMKSSSGETIPYGDWQQDVLELGRLAREKSGQPDLFVFVGFQGPHEGELIGSGSEAGAASRFRDLRATAQILRQLADDYDARADQKDREAAS